MLERWGLKLVIFHAWLLAFIVSTNTIISQENEEFEPLYAGTLLAFFPQNVDPGRISVQPYVFATRVYGLYEQNWSIFHEPSIYNNTLLLSLETGITKFLDVNLIFTESYNKWKNTLTWRYGDTALYFGFQLSRNKRDSWIPDARFLIGEIFPTGKYQKLNPDRLLIDFSGAGSFQTSTALVIRKIFYTYPHPFSVNLNLFYIFPSSTVLKDYNYYGGGPGTHGTVHPGNVFITNLGLEFSLTRQWEIGLDIRYEHQDHSPFHGKTLLPTGLPSSERFNLAPCIEYNFNEDFSIALGSWFSVAGRNNNAFVSWVANVFYMF